MIIHDNNAQPIGTTNPLPVQAARNSISFDAYAYTDNAVDQVLQIRAATTDKSIYVTDIVISSSTAMRVDIKDSDGTTKLTVFLAANTPFIKPFNTPLELTISTALVASASLQAPLAITVAGYEI